MDRFDLIHNIDNKIDNRCLVVARDANIEFRSSLNRFLLPIPRAGNLLIRSSLIGSFAHWLIRSLAHFAQIKCATVSNSLKTNERL